MGGDCHQEETSPSTTIDPGCDLSVIVTFPSSPIEDSQVSQIWMGFIVSSFGLGAGLISRKKTYMSAENVVIQALFEGVVADELAVRLRPCDALAAGRVDGDDSVLGNVEVGRGLGASLCRGKFNVCISQRYISTKIPGRLSPLAS